MGTPFEHGSRGFQSSLLFKIRRAKKARLHGLFFDEAQEQWEQQAGGQHAPGGQAGDVGDGQALGVAVLPDENGRWPLPHKATKGKFDDERLGFGDEGVVWGGNGRPLHGLQLNKISKIGHRTSLFVTGLQPIGDNVATVVGLLIFLEVAV